MRGLFITFEGGEGVGKSTQIERLAEHLKGMGHDVLITREPGGSPGAEAVRHVLLSGAAEELGTDMEAILFAAARSDNVETVIKPALKSGKTVLCDRYMDSSRVYQGMTGKVAPELMNALENAATEDAKPDLTLIFDMPAEESLKRAKARRGNGSADRYEKEDLEMHAARRDGFLEIARREPERCVVIDAGRGPEAVAWDVLRAVSSAQARIASDKSGDTNDAGR